MIPKNIFQTWYTKELPAEIQESINRMQKLNPDYNYYFYTDEEMDDFVKKNYPGEIYECYSKINLIVVKADFWRYLILYKYGGIYLDIDSTINVSLNELINQKQADAILSTESNRNTFTQWALIFNLNHPILKKTIEFIVDNIKNNLYNNDVLSMSGPVVFTRGINSVHKDFFGNTLDVINIDHNIDIVYTHCSNSYRILNTDYRPYFDFKHPYSHLLYKKKPHWSSIKENILKPESSSIEENDLKHPYSHLLYEKKPHLPSIKENILKPESSSIEENDLKL